MARPSSGSRPLATGSAVLRRGQDPAPIGEGRARGAQCGQCAESQERASWHGHRVLLRPVGLPPETGVREESSRRVPSRTTSRHIMALDRRGRSVANPGGLRHAPWTVECAGPQPRSRAPDRRGPGPDRRAGGPSRDLSRAGRDQHHRLRGRQHPGRRGHGGPPARGGLSGGRRPGAGAGAAQGQPGGPLPGDGRAQAVAAAGPPRRGRGPARGLDHRSVHAGGEGRLLLRPRHQRRQGDGRDLRRHADPPAARGLPAHARHHPGADRRRGAGLELQVQRRALAPGQPPRPDRGRAGDQRGRRRRDPRRPAHGEPPADEREGAAQLPPGGHEPGRPQLAAAQGQRHLPAGRGPGAAGRVRVSRPR